MVQLKQVVSIIQSGDWFSFAAITANEKTRAGGKIIRVPRARICRGSITQPNVTNLSPAYSRSEREAIVHVPTNHTDHSEPSSTISRNPNHNYNFTRNLELPNRQIIKVHPSLIFEINKKPVI